MSKSANPLFSSEIIEALCRRFPEDVDFFQVADCNIDRENLQIHESIAKGAFGTVHKGEYNGKKVAVKIQNVPISIKEECANVMVELSLMQSMPHERLIQYIGADAKVLNEDTVEVIIVMDLCERGSLRECLKLPLIPWKLRVRMALDIAWGLEFLHDNGIVHRDVKTSNVLVDSKWRALICDMSFACHRYSSTRMDYSCGTEAYMSPEIILAMDCDISSDVFSFGIILCSIITGQEPSADFLHRSAKTMFEINKEEVRESLIAGCPESLEALAYQCCETEPMSRPVIAQCIEELEAILFDLGGADFTFQTERNSLYARRDRESLSTRKSMTGYLRPSEAYNSNIGDLSVKFNALERQVEEVRSENKLLHQELSLLRTELSEKWLSTSVEEDLNLPRVSASGQDESVDDIDRMAMRSSQVQSLQVQQVQYAAFLAERDTSAIDELKLQVNNLLNSMDSIGLRLNKIEGNRFQLNKGNFFASSRFPTDPNHVFSSVRPAFLDSHKPAGSTSESDSATTAVSHGTVRRSVAFPDDDVVITRSGNFAPNSSDANSMDLSSLPVEWKHKSISTAPPSSSSSSSSVRFHEHASERPVQFTPSSSQSPLIINTQLSLALSSFLNVVEKCNESTIKAKEIVQSLDDSMFSMSSSAYASNKTPTLASFSTSNSDRQNNISSNNYHYSSSNNNNNNQNPDSNITQNGANGSSNNSNTLKVPLESRAHTFSSTPTGRLSTQPIVVPTMDRDRDSNSPRLRDGMLTPDGNANGSSAPKGAITKSFKDLSAENVRGDK